MKKRLVGFRVSFLLGTAVLFPMLSCVIAATSRSGPVVFNRDIRPILSDNCLHCHGFDANKRKANLRLDIPEGATAITKGRQAVKPGTLAESELWKRVTSKDRDVVMPPPDSGKKLNAEQIALFSKWIQEGAAYQAHWAFEPPVRPELPPVLNTNWPANPIDRFILATLEGRNLHPSREARKETLIRRVTLDLSGLPPTPAEVNAFLSDNSADAYARVVDRLLASPRYGEHMARYWLDLARYGDTHGLHLDNERSIWAYRDWVVSAFNRNLPFDQFTVWQLAGDLLPNPTREQLIASGFNRCNVSTSEGGAIDEEFQVRYAVDRVETTSTTWMGLTMGCAVCHDHKLDPITQKEFYQVFSIFNNMAENAMDGNALLPPPVLSIPSTEQEKKADDLKAQIGSLEQRIRTAVQALDYQDPGAETNRSPGEPRENVWIDDAFPPMAELGENSGNEPHRWVSAPEPVFSGKRSFVRAGRGLHQTYFSKCENPLVMGSSDRLFAYAFLDPKDPPKAVMLQFHTDSWRARAVWGDIDAIAYGAKDTTERLPMGPLPESGKWVRLEVEASRLGLKAGTTISGMAFTQFDGKAYWDKAGVVSITDPAVDPEISLLAWQKSEAGLGKKSEVPAELKALLAKAADSRTAAEAERLRAHFLENVYAGESILPTRRQLKETRGQLAALQKEYPATLISKELDKPRPAYVLLRGEYDKHGDPVGPGVPSVLPPLPVSDKTNRLTFARWLVDPAHPLTSRVTVNRFWQQFFGAGLVKTSEDFGTKGEWPSHPELLDWLATDFVSTGWDVKQFVKLIVSSATYRQDSAVEPGLVRLDPENRLLARGPRQRLDAEVIRDYALYTGGLLNETIGGRGVRSYQPPGIWEAVGYTTSNTAKYSQDKGDALYRRSLYLFWKRTAPPPSMTTFDAPSREQCRSRRERTNTPLQALLTLNDVQFFEAARHLGYRLIREGGRTDAEKLTYGFRVVAARNPGEKETELLSRTLSTGRAHYAKNPEAAANVVSFGDSKPPSDVAAPELAAFTTVANMLLNLDEVLTKN